VRATDFEYRHQTLIHLVLLTCAFLTYLIDRDDIVWALVKDQAHPRLLERLLFAFATVLVGAAAAICTWARAYPVDDLGLAAPLHGPYGYLRYPRHMGTVVYSVGIGSLAPLSGFILLVVGQALVNLRLIRREERLRSAANLQPAQTPAHDLPRQPLQGVAPTWRTAFRQESAKWGLFLTMIAFTCVLRDQVADVLAILSIATWFVLNYSSFNRGSTVQKQRA
jgi:hypothetical protein